MEEFKKGVAELKKFPFFLPFAACPGRCVYCNQNRITGADKIPSVQFVQEQLSALTEPVEVCFFGGSFLRFPKETIKGYLDAVKQNAQEGSKIRFSTYPNDLDNEEICALLKNYEISRIELGIQSLDEAVLKSCRRDLKPEEILKSVAKAAANGFPLGVQLMIGLPGQTAESSFSDLKQLAQIKGNAVWDLRIYPCLVLEDTELAEMTADKRYTPISVETAVEWGGRLLAKAKACGFNIIRVGLQETESLAKSVVAGPHHPALGELIMANALCRELLTHNPDGPWKISRNELSKFSGHDNFGYRILSSATGKSVDDIKALVKFF